ETVYLSIDLSGIGTSNDDYECKGRKSKPKPRKKRPTISKVLKSRYGLKSPEENDNTKPNLEEEKIKRINEPNKPRIRKAKIEIYEPNQESIEKNLEEDKIEDQEIGAKRKEILDQQKSTDMDLNGERNKLYKKENPIILARENRTISVDTACKNTIETSSNLEGKLFGSAEKIDLKPLLQKTMDEINTEKDIPKELIESVKAELNRANTIELDSTITKVNNIVDLVKNTQSTENLEDIKDDISIEEGYRKKKINEKFDHINKYTSKVPSKEAITKKAIEMSYVKEIHVEKDEHEAFKNHERPTEPDGANRDKDKPKTSYYYPKYIKIGHIIETIEEYFENRNSIETDIRPDTTIDLGYTCEAWKRKIETLKRITKKSKDKDLNKTKIQEDYESTTLDHKCEVWIKRKHKIIDKNCNNAEIADTVQDAETLRKDKVQLILLLQNLKSRYQELKVTNSNQIEEKIGMYGPKNEKKQWLGILSRKTTIFRMILYEII
ncbi:19187_t:CDS:2, partial [Gigaspora rosea]